MPPRPSNGVPRKVADFATPRVWWFISPVAAYSVAQAGAGCQGGGTPRRSRRLALDGRPRLCYPLRRDGGISSRAAPFPKNGKGRGDRADPYR